MTDKNKFDGMSTDELEAELKKRKTPVAPKPVDNPNCSVVVEMCKKRISRIANGDAHCDDDFDQYLYEEVMTAVYGISVFDWNNKHTP